MRKAAASRAAATALTCTDQPLGSQPIASAVTTPSTAIWAIARSMKTIPRSSTSWPNGTCVERTSSPARNAGRRISRSALANRGPRQRPGKPVDRVVEQAKQILGAIGAADGEGQHHGCGANPLSDELGTARIFIGRIEDRPHILRRQIRNQLREVLAAGRNTRLGLDRRRLEQAQPILEISPTFVVGSDRRTAEWCRPLGPALHRRR